MTPEKGRLLFLVAQCGFLTTDQAARIYGNPRGIRDPKSSAYKWLRDLYDMGLLKRAAVDRSALAPPGPLPHAAVWAPGENVHIPTKAGLDWLERAGWDFPASRRDVPDYGPRNALFLAHEVLAREARVWLEQCRRAHGGEVLAWVDGTAAHIPPARPDAWFVYRLESGAELVGMVEADRGTERGGEWARKAAGYAAMASSGALRAATAGRGRFRLLALTPDIARRDRVAGDLAATAIADSAWAAVAGDLLDGGLDRPVWVHAATGEAGPLVPSERLLP